METYPAWLIDEPIEARLIVNTPSLAVLRVDRAEPPYGTEPRECVAVLAFGGLDPERVELDGEEITAEGAFWTLNAIMDQVIEACEPTGTPVFIDDLDFSGVNGNIKRASEHSK